MPIAVLDTLFQKSPYFCDLWPKVDCTPLYAVYIVSVNLDVQIGEGTSFSWTSFY